MKRTGETCSVIPEELVVVIALVSIYTRRTAQAAHVRNNRLDRLTTEATLIFFCHKYAVRFAPKTPPNLVLKSLRPAARFYLMVVEIRLISAVIMTVDHGARRMVLQTSMDSPVEIPLENFRKTSPQCVMHWLLSPAKACTLA